MSTRLAIDSRQAITVRERIRVDLTLLSGVAVSVSAYALIDQHEPPVTLAIGLLVAVVIGLLIGRSGSGRVSRPEHTLTAYTIQSVVRVVAVSTVYVLLANALGSTGASGAFAAVLVGTLAERVVTFRRALGLDA